MDKESVDRWAAAYARAWEQRSADSVVELFTAHASYRASIFDEPHQGREAIAAYWRRATATQSAVRVRMGEPLVAGGRAAVEWWTTLRDEDGGEITLPGCLLLEFERLRCARLSEYWHVGSGAVEPYEGWGLIAGGDTRATRAAAERWASTWKDGWEALEPAGIVALYAPGAVHRSGPLREPEVGGVPGYLDRCFPDEHDVGCRFEVWAASGAHALTVYAAALRDDTMGGEVTIAGCDMLRFSDQRLCIEQRDYWNFTPGRVPLDRVWPA